jgi:hypothetical protein
VLLEAKFPELALFCSPTHLSVGGLCSVFSAAHGSKAPVLASVCRSASFDFPNLFRVLAGCSQPSP